MILLVPVLLVAALVGTIRDAQASFPVTVYTNVAYKEQSPPGTAGNLLDLYVPEVNLPIRRPLVIWSEGCAWLCDNGKEGAAAIADFFNQRGFAVAGVSIRSSFQVAFPGQLHDIRAAIRWLRENATQYNLDPNRFAIMGNSSGGWAAAIAGTTSDVLQLPGEPSVGGISSAVHVAVPFFPPTEFLEMNAWYVENPGVISFIDHDAPHVPLPPNPFPLPPWLPPAASPESILIRCTDSGGNLLGIQTCPTETQAANPITYIQGDEVPMLILHGDADALVPHGQSELLYQALADAGNAVTFISVAGAGHSVSDPTVFNPIIGAQDVTVFHTNRFGYETITDRPLPTWENIARYIRLAMLLN
jgi:acetyl esterase/lipase